MSYERRPREMHKATCGDCGNECQVPFEPKETDLFIARNASQIIEEIKARLYFQV